MRYNRTTPVLPLGDSCRFYLIDGYCIFLLNMFFTSVTFFSLPETQSQKRETASRSHKKFTLCSSASVKTKVSLILKYKLPGAANAMVSREVWIRQYRGPSRPELIKTSPKYSASNGVSKTLRTQQ